MATSQKKPGSGLPRACACGNKPKHMYHLFFPPSQPTWHQAQPTTKLQNSRPPILRLVSNPHVFMHSNLAILRRLGTQSAIHISLMRASALARCRQVARLKTLSRLAVDKVRQAALSRPRLNRLIGGRGTSSTATAAATATATGGAEDAGELRRHPLRGEGGREGTHGWETGSDEVAAGFYDGEDVFEDGLFCFVRLANR